MPYLTDRHPEATPNASAPTLHEAPTERTRHRVSILRRCWGSVSQLGWPLARVRTLFSSWPSRETGRRAGALAGTIEQAILAVSLPTMSGQALQASWLLAHRCDGRRAVGRDGHPAGHRQPSSTWLDRALSVLRSVQCLLPMPAMLPVTSSSDADGVPPTSRRCKYHGPLGSNVSDSHVHLLGQPPPCRRVKTVLKPRPGRQVG